MENRDAASPINEEAVRQLLRQVVDPEMAINIVDLGLVYRIEIAPDRVVVEMTMTSPACPMGQMIIDDVEAVLGAGLPAGCRPAVVLVWNPPWGPERMSEKSRRSLGWEAD